MEMSLEKARAEQAFDGILAEIDVFARIRSVLQELPETKFKELARQVEMTAFNQSQMRGAAQEREDHAVSMLIKAMNDWMLTV